MTQQQNQISSKEILENIIRYGACAGIGAGIGQEVSDDNIKWEIGGAVIGFFTPIILTALMYGIFYLIEQNNRQRQEVVVQPNYGNNIEHLSPLRIQGG